MKKDDIKVLWNIYCKIAEKICSLSENISFNPNEKDFKDFCNKYEEYKNFFKSNISINESNNDIHLDRHKIASTFYLVINTLKLIKQKENSKNKYQFIDLTANEQSAIAFGLNIISLFNYYDMNKFMGLFKKKLIIELPECNHGKSYLTYLIKLLKRSENTFNKKDEQLYSFLLYLSNVFFLLDKYSFKPYIKISGVLTSILSIILIFLILFGIYSDVNLMLKIFLITIGTLFSSIMIFIKALYPFSISRKIAERSKLE